VLGVLVSLCSIGAGALGVAVLFFLFPRLRPVRIVGSETQTATELLAMQCLTRCADNLGNELWKEPPSDSIDPRCAIGPLQFFWMPSLHPDRLAWRRP
jgi:hypothetical protein